MAVVACMAREVAFIVKLFKSETRPGYKTLIPTIVTCLQKVACSRRALGYGLAYMWARLVRLR